MAMNSMTKHFMCGILILIIVCRVDTKPYKLRPFLLHSTNSIFTHHFRPSPFYSSSCNKHTHIQAEFEDLLSVGLTEAEAQFVQVDLLQRS
jgi:hypothetical protein